MTAEVVVVGSFMSDVVTYADRLPNAGETITGTKLVLCCGGKGANQCVTAARLGARTAMIGKLGNDSFGREHMETMKNEGINMEHITTTDSAPTGVGQLTVLPDGQNRVITVSGSNAFLAVDDINNAKGLIEGAKVLLSENQLEKETVIAALRLANELNVTTILNAAPARSDLEREFFELTDIFCVNETEAEVTAGEKVQSVEDAIRTAKKLLQMGCKRHVLITLGAQGAVLVTRGSEESPVHVRAPAVSAVDTTGAGDCFLGSLAYFLARHPDLSLEKAIENACFVASLSVQKPGTQPSFPYRNELPPQFL